MIPIQRLAQAQPHQRQASFAESRCLTQLRILSCEGGTVELLPLAEESLLVILGGTFDLFAGGNSWAARGTRKDPFEGRPCALYLPARVDFTATGKGEILMVSARPAAETVKPKATRPMLPLAGSGKAYDSATGTWERLEDMPTAPEAILPRRIAVSDQAGVRIEHVFPQDYKAQVLSLDELVLGSGQHVTLSRPPGALELGVYFRCSAGAHLQLDGSRLEQEGIVTGATTQQVTAHGGRVYLAVMYGGKDGA